MKKLSLKDRLVRYLQRKGTWVASGELQRLAQENGSYSPQNCGRRLREATEDGILEVEYRNPHNHAWYRYKLTRKTIEEVQIVEIDGRPVAKRIMKEIYA